MPIQNMLISYKGIKFLGKKHTDIQLYTLVQTETWFINQDD